MKITTTVTTALFTGILGLGIANQASAMANHGPFALSEGNTTSRLASGTDRYQLEVQDSARLTIESRGWHPGGGIDGRISAVLLDNRNNVIEKARSSIGNFVSERQLTPGEYILEVDGPPQVGRRSYANYQLDVNIE